MADPAPPRPGALLVTRNLPPLLGGMERLNQRLVEALATKYDVSVVGPAGSTRHLPSDGVEVVEVPHRPLPRFLSAAMSAALRMARRRAISLVVAGSGLSAPLAWLAARRARAKYVVYLHGLDLVAPSAVYQWLWMPFIRHADLAFANSANTARLAVARGVKVERIVLLHPGTDLPGADVGARVAFRAQHALGERPLLLSVGRLTARKGLPEFVSEALPRILHRRPETMLVVNGADARDALQGSRESQSERLLAAAKRAGVAHAVRLLPPCDDPTLSAAYRAADVHVFPVLDMPGDVEGFGMVAIEAAAHGLPTVAFSVGGVPDAIVEGKSGYLADAGDYAAFATQVEYCLSRRDQPDVRTQCLDAAVAFGWDRFAERLHASLRNRLRSAA